MQAWFNEPVNASFEFEKWAIDEDRQRREMEQGYATPVGELGGHAVLAFQNVEEHVDGNGWAALWLVQGSGVFYVDGQAIEMNPGDVAMFDDNLEHGFESKEPCLGVNFLLGRPCEIDEARALISRFNAPRRGPKF